MRRARRPWELITLSAAVSAVLALPLVFLLIEAHGEGTSTIVHLVFRPLTARLLWNTVRLTVVVTALCAVIGTAAAWFIERTDLPGRRVWAVLVVVPLAIPDFVVSFGWASLSTWVEGFRGAVLVMTLAVYPLVYLPVAASFRRADPGQEEAARSLGVGRVRTFWRITLGQARVAILGGCLLVTLVLLAEYGAFEILGYQTFTTEIFTEFNVSFNVLAACALALVLVLVSLAVLFGERLARGRGRVSRSGPLAQRVAYPQRLGRAKPVVLAGFAALVGLALGVPVGACVYWMLEAGHAFLTGVSLADAAWHTALYSGLAAALATVMALPVALLSVRHEGRVYQLLERSTYLVLAMPGVVIALAFSYFTERYADGFLYQSAPLLVIAYAVLFFPLALVGVKASVAQAPVRLDEVARSLGERRLAVLRRVTLPLVGPGLAAAFCLVFLSAVTELTATLILIPTGVQTLATQFWAYQQNLAYGQAAPFALAIIAVAAVPSYVLGRFFDRLPARAR
ncbi:MAG TPA: iron ABC transporter permease [Solirubrobacteraceae bacterium]|nr:iron ABC transporter permease [Solirubrobacteraceae bacterium]